MNSDIARQFDEILKGSGSCLITFRKDSGPDAIGSALALARTMRERGQRAEIVADGFIAPKSLSFLPDLSEIGSGFRKLQKFVISLDVSRAGIEDMSYDLVGDRLKIYVTPKSGQFAERDIAAESSDFRYDLIVCLDTPNYGSLGETFSRNADLFYRLPVVNIDADPANERFGNLNVVDISASSSAEVLYGLLKATGCVPDGKTATCLLTGMIAKTRSFRTPQVTPNTLNAASELIAAGAERELIVRSLYRNRSLQTLKLWGRALSRLKHDPNIRFAWTLLVRQDFIHAGANDDFLPDVMEELMSNSPEAEICGVLYEQARTPDGKPAGICALIRSDDGGDAAKLTAGLRPEGNDRLARICFPTQDLIEAERAVLETVYRSLGRPFPYGERTPESQPVPGLGHPDLIPVRPA